ncbi:hypothetical protein ASD00_18380 [Ensifer sp. Root31]|uniref:hypothetical protein n=1 Tax=Ensifer sp. Root31 TaxID=1736512 RepID=UPI00070AF16A|nr:hypothetical protein [Ensifer sp. Root31]KQU96813.1 hypothetical protein ASD00_18380 [Ensifer sp. Root31]
MLTSSNMRTIIAAIGCVEREEIEVAGEMSDKRWRDFQTDPHRTFMKLNDEQQAAVTEIVNRRIAMGHNSAARRDFASVEGARL